jgi:hypothetical protein
MPDRLEKLRATLSELEAELRELDSLDEPTRQLLADAADEISAILRKGQRSDTAENVETALRDRVVEFEASHPQLAGIVSRLLDGLGQLGI